MSWLGWAVLSAVFAAATALLAKVGVAGVDANLAVAVRTTVVMVVAWLICAMTGGAAGAARLGGRPLLFLVLSGLATAGSWLCYFQALQAGDVSRVAPIDKLSLVLVIAFAAVFLGEPLTWPKAAGALLILAGTLLVTAG